MKTFLVFAVCLIVAQKVIGQQKVANYSTGTPGTKNYEHFSFWTEDGKRSEITYTYGADRKEQHLTYSSSGVKTSFRVTFPNKYVLTIVPYGNKLKVTDTKGKYNKTFSWEYEGPVNGIGTFCEPCAQDETEAAALLKSAYIK